MSKFGTQAKSFIQQPGDITDPGGPKLPVVSKAYVQTTPTPTQVSTPTPVSTVTPTPTPTPANTGQYGQYTSIIEQASQKYGVPPGLIYSVIMQESGGNPNAVNPTSGCTGLMQLTPGEFSGDLTDPTNNIMQGTAYLAQLYQQKGGDWVATLAAYNLGPNANIDSTVPGQNGLTGRQYAEQVLARYENGA
jgi:soluble lytic murein transglycosylase-like protein